LTTSVATIPKNFATFQKPILADLARFHEKYRTTLLSGIGVIDQAVNYLTRKHGKGVRPTLTLLCAKLGGDTLSDGAIRAAVIIELLHEATLVHDDVVDESPIRRGRPALHKRFRNKFSILFGDYMLAHVLTETLEARDLVWMEILSHTARNLSRGELVQAAYAKRLRLSEEEYLRMIADKTGALFGACCRLGGITGGLNDDQVTLLGEFGVRLGVAFQIKDDLLDLFGERSFIGKQIGGDLKERKITLPLLAALSNARKRESRRIKARIRRGVKGRDIRLIRDFIVEHGGDKYAEKIMNAEIAVAREACASLPDVPARSMLFGLAEFMILRRK
jgi:octaprenyl-diphosphate synthase